MVSAARQAFWRTTLRVTLLLLTAWLAVNLLVPWFARDLDALQGFGFPAGYWMAAEGTLLVYLLIIVVYVVAMDRLEARLVQQERSADAAAPASRTEARVDGE